MEGDVEKIADQFRIRRGMAEGWIPADKAMRPCFDWAAAYVFMTARSNLSDPDERLRLVRWCQLNGLRAQALTEAKIALQMRPAHAETKQLVTILERTIAAEPVQAKAAPTAAPVTAPPPPIDLSSDSFALFATKVQPILMNTCVSCHSGGRGGDFQLIRTDGGQRVSTQRNLAAVLAQVHMEKTVLSPLLIKAVSAHGGAANPPIISRQSPPFRSLQEWVENVLANNPHLRFTWTPPLAQAAHTQPETFASAEPLPLPPLSFKKPPTPTPKINPIKFEATTQPQPLPPLPEATPLEPLPQPEKTPPKNEVPTPTTPPTANLAQIRPLPPPPADAEPQPAANDPYDPAVFNKQMHPKR